MVQAIPSSLQLRYHIPHSTYSEGKYNYFKPLPFKCSVHNSTKNANSIKKGYYFVDSIHSKYMQGSIERRKQRLRIKSALKSSLSTPTRTHDLDDIQCSNSRQRTHHRRVHFSKTNDVRILPEKTSEDKFHSWYSKNDYAKFESDRKRTVHKLQQIYQSSSNDMSNQHYHLDPNEYTVVGVEHYIYGRKQIMLRKLHSLRHTRSVLQQQQYNKDYQHENYYSYTPYNYNNMDYNNNMSYCCTNYHNNFDESLRYVSQLYSTQSMMNGRSCHDMLQPLQV